MPVEPFVPRALTQQLSPLDTFLEHPTHGRGTTCGDSADLQEPIGTHVSHRLTSRWSARRVAIPGVPELPQPPPAAPQDVMHGVAQVLAQRLGTREIARRLHVCTETPFRVTRPLVWCL